MFFLPHNLCCLCRKGDNPVWSHQSVSLSQWNEKTANITILSGLPSYSSSCQSHWSALLFTRNLHPWAFNQVNQNFKFQENILWWKYHVPVASQAVKMFIVHSSRKTLTLHPPTFCFTQHINKWCHDRKHVTLVAFVAKLHWENTSIRFFCLQTVWRGCNFRVYARHRYTARERQLSSIIYHPAR